MSKLIKRAIAEELKNGPITLKYLEEQLILITIKYLDNDLLCAAASLGICDRTLLNKRRRMGIAYRQCKRKAIPIETTLPSNSMETAKTYKVGKYDSD